MCPRTTVYVSSYLLQLCCSSVAALLQLCPRTAIYKSACCSICVHIVVGLAAIHVFAYYYMCVRILVHVCPRTSMYVSAYYYLCVLMLVGARRYVQVLCMFPHTTRCVRILQHVCPHTCMYVSAYAPAGVFNCYVCVRIPLCMCLHTTTMCVRILLYACQRMPTYSALILVGGGPRKTRSSAATYIYSLNPNSLIT
jgi:hypothetical protein